MGTKHSIWLVAGLALIGSGCLGTPQGIPDACDAWAELPPGVTTDILFVIDNSKSMYEEQAKVVAQLQTFVDVLSSGAVENDFQVGVITTAVTKNTHECDETEPTLTRYDDESGRLQQGKDIEGNVLDPSSDKIIRADDPDLVSKFGALVSQGIEGSGQEMGFEAMRRALSPPVLETPPDATPSGNAGFLRPGSRLLVVIVSDEDDCSDPDVNMVVEPICGPYCTTNAECTGTDQCLPDGKGDRRCMTSTCETERELLAPVSEYLNFLRGLTDGTAAGRQREVFLAVIGAVDPDDPTTPLRCSRGGTEATGTAVRYAEAVTALGVNASIDSICRDDYGATLTRIAELVSAPHVLNLEDGPADGRLLRIDLTRADGSTVECRYGDGFTYQPAYRDAPARVTLFDHCRLRQGDEIRIRLFCAS
jgi:hypothetical protein